MIVTATTPGGESGSAVFDLTGAPSWQAAIDSGSYTTVDAWYSANTGHEAAGYAVGDLASGDIDSEYDGQTFEGITSGRIRIGHDNVTVRGCRVVGGYTYGYYTNPSFGATHTGTLIEYCTFYGGTTPVDKAAILVGNRTQRIDATFRNCNVEGWSSGVLAQGSAAVEYCYFHDFYKSSTGGAHVSSMNCTGQVVRFHRNYAIEGGSNLAGIYYDVRAIHDVEITENVLSARQATSGNLPSYLIQGKSGDYQSGANGIVVGGNYLGDTLGTDFQYGQVSGLGVAYPNVDFLTGTEI